MNLGKLNLCRWIFCVLLGTSCAVAAPAEDFKLTGPFTHDNLSIYLVHGEDQKISKELQPDSYLTLAEAMAEGGLIVHETGNVNQLSVENLSKNKYVFIQAGEIVKGGKQDRVLSRDLLLQPASGRVSIGAFCVEQGRWNKRGGENIEKFSSARKMVSSKGIKIANQVRGRQSEVWDKIAKQQAGFSRRLRKSVNSAASPTSLQLSLEDKDVAKLSKTYMRNLVGLASEAEDSVGFVFAINGKINSAEIYATHELFNRQWKRLLEAAAAEAISEASEKAKPSTPPSKDEVIRFIKHAQKGELTTRSITAGTALVTREAKRAHFQESAKGKDSKNWLHRSYLSK